MVEATRDNDDIPDNFERNFVERSSTSGCSPNNSTSLNGRTTTVNAEKSSMSIKSAVLSAGRWVKGVNLIRLELTDAMKTSLNEIAQQSKSFETIPSPIQIKAQHFGGSPPEHKPVTADSANTIPKSLRTASATPRRRVLKHSYVAGENGAADSSSSVSYPLLPGAIELTGGRFLSPQSIFDVLSEPNVRERAVSAIPIGPKVNCYFILNIGVELTDFEKYFDNRQRIRDKLRDEFCSRRLYLSSNTCFTLSASGILKYIHYYKPNKDSLLDLRMHTFNFRNPEHSLCEQTATLRVCWFFNA